MTPGAAPVYVTPDGRAAGAYAAVARRLGAGAIDWTICFVLYLLVSIPAGVVQIGGSVDETIGEITFVVAQVLVGGALVAYWAGYLRTGSTLGMRTLGIETVVASTGRDPGMIRALLRGVVAVALGACTYLALMAAIGDRTQAWSDRQELVADMVTVVALLGAAGKLPMVWSAARQSVWDRLFGVVVVDALVSTAPGSFAYDLWLEQRARKEA